MTPTRRPISLSGLVEDWGTSDETTTYVDGLQQGEAPSEAVSQELLLLLAMRVHRHAYGFYASFLCVLIFPRGLLNRTFWWTSGKSGDSFGVISKKMREHSKSRWRGMV